jgi:hypothetical protein
MPLPVIAAIVWATRIATLVRVLNALRDARDNWSDDDPQANQRLIDDTLDQIRDARSEMMAQEPVDDEIVDELDEAERDIDQPEPTYSDLDSAVMHLENAERLADERQREAEYQEA